MAERHLRIPQEYQKSRDRLGEKTKRWMKKTTAAAAVTTSLLTLNGDTRASESFEIETSVVPMALVLNGQTSLNFLDLSNVNETTGKPFIQPSPELQKIITADNKEMEGFGLLPLKIREPKVFTQWVSAQSQRSDIREIVDITDEQESTAKQLVKLSAAIVVANQSYYEDSTKSEEEILEVLDRRYHAPIDETLRKRLPINCEGYSAATLAVFNEIKKAYPETLRNTYMATFNGNGKAHEWNIVFNVNGPSEANISFVDATEDDPDWKEGHGKVKLSYIDLIEGLYNNGTIDVETTFDLAWQYEQAGKMTTQELQKVLDPIMFHLGRNNSYDTAVQYKGLPPTRSHVKLAEAYLSRLLSEAGGDENDEFNKIESTQIFLFNYYVNPKAKDRPADWYKRAKDLGEAINNSTSEHFHDDVSKIFSNPPKTSEEYYAQYPDRK